MFRKLSYLCVGLFLLIMSGGCNAAGSSLSLDVDATNGTTTSLQDSLYIAGENSITALLNNAQIELPYGAFHPNNATLYVATPTAYGTTVQALQLPDGSILAERTLMGRYDWPSAGVELLPKSFSPDGRWLVLHRTDSPAEQSEFTILDSELQNEPRTVSLDGDFHFDAIGNSAEHLFLIEDLSEQQEGAYQVRQYDVNEQYLEPNIVADKRNDQTEMAGAYIASAASDDGQWLYGLYVRNNAHPFIHALNLDNRYAMCIFLPGDSSGSAEEQHLWSLALSENGHDLYAVNGSLGLVAEVDTIDNVVRRSAWLTDGLEDDSALSSSAKDKLTLGKSAQQKSAQLQSGNRNSVKFSSPRRGQGALLSADGQSLYALGANGLLVIETSDLALQSHLLPDRQLSSIALSADGNRLYATDPLRAEILQINVKTGAVEQILDQIPQAPLQLIVPARKSLDIALR